MIIGTVQFGLDYGVNSSTAKKINQEQCNEILDVALENGIAILDTAEAYGDAIDKIANYHDHNPGRFEIISKFLIPEDIINPLTHSLAKMAIGSYHTILAHKSQDLFFNEDVQRDLTTLKHAGFTKYIGVSIYTNDEFQQSIDCEYVDVIQFPYNLLDNVSQRGELMLKAKDAGKILHARSAYLQGMFLKPFPLPDKLRPLEVYLQKLKDLCQENGLSMAGLCLEYAFSNNLIDNVVIGHHIPAQLLGNIELIKNFNGGPYLHEIDAIRVNEAHLLNPRNW